ncbi:hypothetical protein L1887_26864 [Cichorium endivia]|nr:hypothetical protein L1887_26864 [Cichorium endivia]
MSSMGSWGMIGSCSGKPISPKAKVGERDVSVHPGFKEELKDLLGGIIGGIKCIGGATEIRRLHEDGNLEKALEGCEIVVVVVIINSLASSSVTRAHLLKNPNEKSSSTSKIPLFPRSYGGYSVSLSFGSPPQKLSFVMDTGSSLVWFSCTHRYTCYNCDFPNVNQTNIPKFILKLSSSAKIIGCKNKKCGFVFGSSDPIRCSDNGICPAYMLQYGFGSTSELLLSETLDFNEGDATDFVVGCSIISFRQPSGIAGFGRGPASLPVQMGLKKFSYCLVSHRFDDAPVSSELV